MLNQLPDGIFLFKINDKKSRLLCEICSKLTIKTPERRYVRRCGVFINFKPFFYVLVFVLVLSK